MAEGSPRDARPWSLPVAMQVALTGSLLASLAVSLASREPQIHDDLRRCSWCFEGVQGIGDSLVSNGSVKVCW